VIEDDACWLSGLLCQETIFATADGAYLNTANASLFTMATVTLKKEDKLGMSHS
jgi:hypothetical protein